MKSRLIIFFLMITLPGWCWALNIGLSSSGKDISLDMSSQKESQTDIGLYFRLIADSKEYKDGSSVTVCSDGKISGSTGSGTCSGHGGINHTKEAEFSRYAIAFGPTYWATNCLQVYGGIIFGLYSSDVNIGDTSVKDFTETGFDFGVNFKPVETSSFILVIGHETEQKRTYLGFKVSI